MSTTTTTPAVPIPAGAVWVDEWQPGRAGAWRIFNGSERVIAGAPDPLRPFIGGIQNPEGAVHRNIVPPDLHPDNQLSLRQAFDLGLALMELVFEAIEMNKLDRDVDALEAQK
jgi:hypothetical protein